MHSNGIGRERASHLRERTAARRTRSPAVTTSTTTLAIVQHVTRTRRTHSYRYVLPLVAPGCQMFLGDKSRGTPGADTIELPFCPTGASSFTLPFDSPPEAPRSLIRSHMSAILLPKQEPCEQALSVHRTQTDTKYAA